jgi:hypothetical protein
VGLCRPQRLTGGYPESKAAAEFWRYALIEYHTRLRVVRGIAKTETEASVQALSMLKARSQSDQPPALTSDGWDGHREALIEVYSIVTACKGRGRPPIQKRPQPDWQCMQLVKQRKNWRVLGMEMHVSYGNPLTILLLLGEHTAYVDRTLLTSRHMTGRLVRNTLGFSKKRAMLEVAGIWEDVVYNLVRHIKTLRIEVDDGFRHWRIALQAMAAGLTEPFWTIEELLALISVPTNT